MKKTMVYLKDDLFMLLKPTAVFSKKKISEVIRETLYSYLGGR